LNVAVTDNKGNYITGLKPEDFAIYEDKILEKPSTFEEGNGPTRRLVEVAPSDGKTPTPVADNSSGDQNSPDISKRFDGANVFIHGPDNASLVPPEDVAELAQSTATIIYMISTQQAETEPVSTAVFERMSKATGGKAYFAKNWQDEKQAFASIRDDLANLYTI